MDSLLRVRILQKSQKYLLIFLIPEQEHILILESGNKDKPSSSASEHVSNSRQDKLKFCRRSELSKRNIFKHNLDPWNWICFFVKFNA